MDGTTLETAILTLARDDALMTEAKQTPASAADKLGLTPEWLNIILTGQRDRLRSAGVNDGVTILVSRWFNDNVNDSESSGALRIDESVPLPDPSIPTGLVFAGGCSHVPDLLARPEIDPVDGIGRLLSGYSDLKEILTAANPDIILVTTDCHFQSFDTSHFVVGTAAQHVGSMEFFKRPELDLDLKGAPEFAALMVEEVRAAGLEVEPSPRVDLDHGLVVPLRLTLPHGGVPVIPIVTQPHRAFSPYSALRFGQALRGAIEKSGKRIAVLATGGLSHWLDPGKFGGVDVEFDTYILDLLKAGRGQDLANLEPYPLLDHGQYEIQNWIIMLGVVGPAVPADVLAYEPMEASGGGWTVVNLPLTPH
ncbi:protocatechuate 3,4-dioxygenase [Rhodococcus globerulus]|uniref:DODA-type extradiol aromatic ring-opening family dioxygenase n=1 Tax=Rhodococcus globerulus TaxID=33008 RepID=UPI000689A0F1|nr:protocatechuate 3,4-dioxygenase [Rhodococcus globerulus]PVX59526.1 protocatechuate 4,5-dioxygenase beta chain [Rhodococcus globerulus]